MKACARCGSTRVDPEWNCRRCEFKPVPTTTGLSFVASVDDGGFDSTLFARLAAIEDSNFWFVARNRLISWAVRSHFSGARTVLEIGSGTGFVLQALRRELPAAELIGTDFYQEGLPFAAARVPDATLLQVDARRIPYRDHFELAGAFDVLEHIDDDQRVLEQLREAVVPGGGLLLTVPQHPALWSRQDVLAAHHRRYTRAGLRARLTHAGFETLRIRSFVSLLLPAMMAARLSPAGGRVEDAAEALQPGPIVNRALSMVMTMERALIQRGLSFPAGGSLLVAARRVT
jgi:SAM-dependent methyltransferase